MANALTPQTALQRAPRPYTPQELADLEAAFRECERPDDLTEEQCAVLRLLTEGASVASAARQLQIDRSTIYRWMNKSANFRGVYRQWQEYTADACRSRLRMLADKAVRTLERALDAGDAASARAIITGLSLLQPADRNAGEIERPPFPPPQPPFPPGTDSTTAKGTTGAKGT